MNLSSSTEAFTLALGVPPEVEFRGVRGTGADDEFGGDVLGRIDDDSVTV